VIFDVERICDFLHINNSEAHPLKEYIINFTVMNGKKPLTIGFKTFYESTGLDYNKGTYVSHPSPKDVKAKLARITTDEVLINRNPILKTAFPTAWKILFTFVIQVLGGNYSSTKQVNSIQQLIEYCLTTRTKVDIGEIIYSDLVTRLTNKSRQKYVSYRRFVLCALEVLLVIEYTQDKNFKSLSNKEKKTKSHTVSKPKPKTQGPEASGILPQKRKKPKTQKTPGSHYLPNEGTRKSQPFPEGKTTDPKDLKGNKHPTDKGLPFTVPDDYIGTKAVTERGLMLMEQNFKPLKLTTIADIQALLRASDDDLKEDSEDDVFKAGEEMDEYIQEADTEEHQTHLSTKTPTKEPYKSISLHHQAGSHLNPPSFRKIDASDSEFLIS
ncbi:hypothetical protein Tco_1350091, partial [Tanacetum coccineum]